jgi:phage tail-like protein
VLEKGRMLETLYENRLPALYRDADAPKLYLKRYLSAICGGGFDALLSDINGLKDLISPQKTPDAFLPAFLASVGLPFYVDIPLAYQRKILSQFGELYSRRGTYSGLRYLVRVLTGMECAISYERGQAGGIAARRVYVELLATTLEEVASMDVHRKAAERYLSEFLPYYIGVVVSAKLIVQEIRLDSWAIGVVSSEISYNLRGL